MKHRKNVSIKIQVQNCLESLPENFREDVSRVFYNVFDEGSRIEFL